MRLPILKSFVDSPKTRWQSITVPWYSGEERTLAIATGFSVWYHSGKPVVPLRWVLIRDPEGEFDPQALLCTDRSCTPALYN